ncbi:hypothetical protein [Flavobacterium covae]|uniref:hypothetical protein n=1 Tax=Flavobacterium covae TaxID=2906076 RepID=UPI0007C547B3|nr:hypothetical protein [Flavobacterium covae]
MTFLKRNAHEVGHIPQVEYGNTVHIVSSIFQYAENVVTGQNWHNGSYSTKESEADVGENIFQNFANFVDNYYGKDKLKSLLENQKNSDDVKIKRINTWWKKYIDVETKESRKFINNTFKQPKISKDFKKRNKSTATN